MASDAHKSFLDYAAWSSLALPFVAAVAAFVLLQTAHDVHGNPIIEPEHILGCAFWVFILTLLLGVLALFRARNRPVRVAVAVNGIVVSMLFALLSYGYKWLIMVCHQ